MHIKYLIKLVLLLFAILITINCGEEKTVYVTGPNQEDDNSEEEEQNTNNKYAIVGYVEDINSNGIPGVTIMVSGNNYTTDNNGRYIFSVPNGQYTLVPYKDGYTFTPSEKTITINGKGVSLGDFVGSTGDEKKELTLYTKYDTYISEYFHDKNYGDSEALKFGYGTMNKRVQPLIKFNLSKIPSGSEIIKSELILRIGYNNTDYKPYANVTVCRVNESTNSNWSEYSITWDDAQNYKIYIAETQLVQVAKANEYAWNVTEVVQSWINGYPNYGFIIVADKSGYIYSKETYPEGNRLIIQYK